VGGYHAVAQHQYLRRSVRDPRMRGKPLRKLIIFPDQHQMDGHVRVIRYELFDVPVRRPTDAARGAMFEKDGELRGKEIFQSFA